MTMASAPMACSVRAVSFRLSPLATDDPLVEKLMTSAERRFAATKMGAEVTLVGPPTLIPPEAQAWGAEVSHDLDGVLPKLDVCYMLRVQRERQRQQFFPSVREYSRLFGLSAERVAAMPEHALVMHPGPMIRGMEISPEVADGVRSTIVEQVTNGVSVRMAVLYLLLGGPRPVDPPTGIEVAA